MLRPAPALFGTLSPTQSRKLDRLIGLSNICGIVLVCGILFGGGVLAAPPNPPVIVGDDVMFGENNANRINAILDGFTVPSILSGLRYPADPVTTTTHEVRNNSELAAAVSGNGRLIRIFGPANGGLATYNAFPIPPFPDGRADWDIVMDNDATISISPGWSWWNPIRRMRWTGGNIRITSGTGVGWRIEDAEDVLFDDVRMYRGGGGETGHILATGAPGRRFALINSTIEFTEVGTGIYYAWFSGGESAGRGDCIVLNNRFIGEGPPVRMMDLGLRTAIVANYFSEFPASASIRVHRSIDKFWFAHNVSVHGGGREGNIDFTVASSNFVEDAILNDFVIEDNRIFATQSNIMSGQAARYGGHLVEMRDQATNWVIRNNIWSDPTGPAGGEAQGTYWFTVPYTAENNLRVGPGHPDYETAPAASSFGATR